MPNLQVLFGIIALLVSAAFATKTAQGSAGCSRNLNETWTPGGRSASYDIESENRTRHSLLYLPPGYSPEKPFPLIIALHGKDQPPAEFEEHTQLSNPIVNNEYIVVYPEGIKLQWTGDPTASLKSEINDIAFIASLLNVLEKDLCIDQDRIYATGFSNGAGLTHLLACDPILSSRIAAFAASSGAYYTDSALNEPLFSICKPARPIPMLEFHGNADPVEHYDGVTTPDGPSYSITEWLKEWAVRDGCAADQEPRRETLYGGNVQRMSWDCKGVKEVLLHYLISRFGHGWPTTGPLSNDEQRHGPTWFDGTPVVLQFLGRFSLGEGGDRGRDEL